MNSLEKYVRDNRSLFDEEPPAGHVERFQQKMRRKTAKNVALRRVLSIAASIAILTTAGIMWLYREKQAEIKVFENASDMKICYLEKMNMVAEQIELLTTDFDNASRQQLINDVHDIINIANDDFESELPEELPEDVAKVILSDYYRKILESLELIVHQLEIVKNNES